MARLKSVPAWLTPARLRRINSPIPVVEITMCRVWDGSNIIEMSQELLDPELPLDIDGVVLLKSIIYQGLRYRPETLANIGVYVCSHCSSACAQAHLVGGKCVICLGVVEKIIAKRTPAAGWQKHGSWPYVGVEIEMEFPGVQETAMETFKNTVLGAEWYMPMVYTSDSSLVNGVELNTHMMGLDYIRLNKDMFTHCINRVKQSGARHTTENGYESAGVHIHMDANAFGKNPFFSGWLKYHKPFCLSLSGRSAENFDKWCWNSYPYCAPRNKSKTWECRGFSSKLLLETPECLEHMVAWVHTMAYVSRTPIACKLDVYDAMCAAGFSESATYWFNRGVEGMRTNYGIHFKKSLVFRDYLYQRVLYNGHHGTILEINNNNDVVVGVYEMSKIYTTLDQLELLDKQIDNVYSDVELVALAEPLTQEVPF